MPPFSYRNGVLHAEDVALATIAEAVGTPFYCYSNAAIEQHFDAFRNAFAGRAWRASGSSSPASARRWAR